MRIPKLRFKEFSDELVNNYFFEFGDIKIGLTHTPNYVENGKIFLSSKNISKGYIDFEDVQYITKEEFEAMPESTKPKKGDILFTRVGSNLGNPIILEEEKECAIFVSLGIFRANDKANNYYIKHWMDTNYFWNQVEKKVAGGAKNNLNTAWLKEFKINIPSLIEQEKIGNFLSSVDKKISITEEKLNLFKEYKKGMMQKIFKQEIRFKDENGNEYPDWVEKRLGDFIVEYNEKTTKNNQYPVLTSSRKGIFLQKDYFAGQDVASEDTTGYNIVPRGYFTYRHMSDDLIFKFNINNILDTGIVSTLYPVFTTKNINDIFLKEKLNNGDEFKKYSLFQKQGGTRTYMYLSKLIELKLLLPCLEEQEKIAKFLSSIDSKIENLSNKLENLKEFKKGLLQKMFI